MARVENLEFLADVVPRTTTYKEFKRKQAKQKASAEGTNGQVTLDSIVKGPEEDARDSSAMDVDEAGPASQLVQYDDASMQ